MVDMLPSETFNEILTILRDLREEYYLKKEFLDIIHHNEQMNVEKQIDRWINDYIEKNIPEFIEALKTISRWKEYILNSFIDKRYSNGYTEGTNNKIKVLKRVGFGYKDFKFLRGRILYSFTCILSDSTRNKNISNIKNKK